MTEVRNLRIDTHKFVTNALTNATGRKPSEDTINITVERIVKAFSPVLNSTANVSNSKSKRVRK